MVGVAGGSRGCANCKRRKVKCDENFPDCDRCARAGIVCGGPTSRGVQPHNVERTSSNTTPRTRSLAPTATLVPPPVVVPSIATLRSPTPRTRSFTGIRSVFSIRYESSIRQLLASFDAAYATSFDAAYTTAWVLPPELVIFPEFDMYTYLLKVFMERFSMPTNAVNTSAMLPIEHQWTNLMAGFVLSPLPSATMFALLATHWVVYALSYQHSIVKVILEESQTDVIKDSHADRLNIWLHLPNPEPPPPTTNFLSGTTPDVQGLPTSMRTGESATQTRGNSLAHIDDATIAGMILSIYELHHNKANRSWAMLLSGSTELMRLRGPSAYKEGINSIMFRSLRGMLTFHALVSRKDTFLNCVEWKWTAETSPHDILQSQLFDIILELAGFQEVVGRYFMFAMGSGVVDPEDELSPDGEKVIRLRKRFRTEEVWRVLRDVHSTMLSLDARLKSWFARYLLLT
ncbi:uncharacterized protein V1518DRAFT_424256 [Limtongia smithiae]|uniref:uncharacterized protein n=1 Tax=Limtongia smithiae TaxID=1125753 RepID=UPI0034CF52D4